MTKNVKVMLVEDEDYNLIMLKGMICRLRPDWHIVAMCDSVKSSVEWLNSHPQPDILFMDIQLADGLCFTIFDRVVVKGLVIFTTAYDNYAIRAFKVNSIDYLLKPFKESDLELAICKFEKFTIQPPGKISHYDFHELLEAVRVIEKKYRRAFLVGKGSGYIRIDVSSIAYFQYSNRITSAVTFDNQTYIMDFALDALEGQLDPCVFYRANRQFVINIGAVVKIENHFGGKLKLRLTPPPDNEILVSRLKAIQFRQWLGQ